MRAMSAVFVLAGMMILLSVILSATVSQWWLLLSVFVGVNLVQSAFTGFCPAEIIFKKLGMADCDCEAQRRS